MTYQHVDQTYFDLINDVLTNGVEKTDRTGTGTISVFGRQCRYDLTKGFPIITSKRVHWKSVVGELLWFLKGDTNIKWLKENGISIWDEWADKDGNLGPVYGKQWRSWTSLVTDLSSELHMKDGIGFIPTYKDKSIDQIKDVIQQIKTNPDSRRLIVSTWNVADIPQMALAPCHGLPIQFDVTNGKLSCQVYIRSNDLGLGNPFNVASYALLTHIIAQVCDLTAGELIITIGNLHIYSNHVEALKQQLHRTPYPMAHLLLDERVKDVDSFTFDDIKIMNYQHHPSIKLPVAV